MTSGANGHEIRTPNGPLNLLYKKFSQLKLSLVVFGLNALSKGGWTEIKTEP